MFLRMCQLWVREQLSHEDKKKKTQQKRGKAESERFLGGCECLMPAASPELGEDDLQETQRRVQLRAAAGRQQPIEALAEQLLLRQAEAAAGLEHLADALQVGAQRRPERQPAGHVRGLVVELFGRLVEGGSQPAGLRTHIQTPLLENNGEKRKKEERLVRLKRTQQVRLKELCQRGLSEMLDLIGIRLAGLPRPLLCHSANSFLSSAKKSTWVRSLQG